MTPLERLLNAFEAGDLAAGVACFAADAVYLERGRAPVEGREAIARHFAAFAAGGSNWEFFVDDVILDEERACVVYRFASGKGDRDAMRERAGCATVRLDASGAVAHWREYEG